MTETETDLGARAFAFVKAHPGCTIGDLEACGQFENREHGVALAFALMRGWVYSDHKLRNGVADPHYYPTPDDEEG